MLWLQSENDAASYGERYVVISWMSSMGRENNGESLCCVTTSFSIMES